LNRINLPMEGKTAFLANIRQRTISVHMSMTWLHWLHWCCLRASVFLLYTSTYKADKLNMNDDWLICDNTFCLQCR